MSAQTAQAVVEGCVDIGQRRAYFSIEIVGRGGRAMQQGLDEFEHHICASPAQTPVREEGVVAPGMVKDHLRIDGRTWRQGGLAQSARTSSDCVAMPQAIGDAEQRGERWSGAANGTRRRADRSPRRARGGDRSITWGHGSSRAEARIAHKELRADGLEGRHHLRPVVRIALRAVGVHRPVGVVARAGKGHAIHSGGVSRRSGRKTLPLADLAAIGIQRDVGDAGTRGRSAEPGRIDGATS